MADATKGVSLNDKIRARELAAKRYKVRLGFAAANSQREHDEILKKWPTMARYVDENWQHHLNEVKSEKRNRR